MMLAAMDQYRTLWPEDAGGAPPLFNFFQQLLRHGRARPTARRCGYKVLAPRRRRRQSENLHAERVDGYKPPAWRVRRTRSCANAQSSLKRPRSRPARHDDLPHCGPFPRPTPPATGPPRRSRPWQQADAIEAYGAYLGGQRRCDRPPNWSPSAAHPRQAGGRRAVATRRRGSRRASGGAFIESVMSPTAGFERHDGREPALLDSPSRGAARPRGTRLFRRRSSRPVAVPRLRPQSQRRSPA